MFKSNLTVLGALCVLARSGYINYIKEKIKNLGAI